MNVSGMIFGLVLAALPAAAVAGMSEIVELQVNVCDEVGDVLRSLEIEPGDAVKRETYLFDTSKLELVDAHVTIRLRVEEEDSELAVKVSELSAGDMARWELAGADCEYDDHFENGAEQLSGACKFLKVLDEREARGLKGGKSGVSEFLSPQQRKLVAAQMNAIAGARVLGPLRDRVWKLKEDGFDKKISVEESRTTTGLSFIEISTRTTLESSGRAQGKLRAWLRESGVGLCADQSGQRRRKMRELVR